MFIVDSIVYLAKENCVESIDTSTGEKKIHEFESKVLAISNYFVLTQQALYNLKDYSVYESVVSINGHSTIEYLISVQKNQISCYSNVKCFSISLEAEPLAAQFIPGHIPTTLIVFSNSIALYYKDELANSIQIPSISTCTVVACPLYFVLNNTLYDLLSLMPVCNIEGKDLYSFNNCFYKLQFTNQVCIISKLSLSYSLLQDQYTPEFIIVNQCQLPIKELNRDLLSFPFLLHSSQIINLLNPLSDSAIIEDDPVHSLMQRIQYSHPISSNPNPMLQYALNTPIFTELLSILSLNKEEQIDSNKLFQLFCQKSSKLSELHLNTFSALCEHFNGQDILNHYIERYTIPEQLQLLRICCISYIKDLKCYSLLKEHIKDAEMVNYISTFYHKNRRHLLNDRLLCYELCELFQYPLKFSKSFILLLSDILLDYGHSYQIDKFKICFESHKLAILLEFTLNELVHFSLNRSDNNDFILIAKDLLVLPLSISVQLELKEWILEDSETLLNPLEQLEANILQDEWYETYCTLLDPLPTEVIAVPLIANKWLSLSFEEWNPTVSQWNPNKAYQWTCQLHSQEAQVLFYINLLELHLILRLEHQMSIDSLLEVAQQQQNEHIVVRCHQLLKSIHSNSIEPEYSESNYNSVINAGDVVKALTILHYGSFTGEWVQDQFMSLFVALSSNKDTLYRFMGHPKCCCLLSPPKSLNFDEFSILTKYIHSPLLEWTYTFPYYTENGLVHDKNYSQFLIHKDTGWNLPVKELLKLPLLELQPLVTCMDDYEQGIALFMSKLQQNEYIDQIEGYKQLLLYMEQFTNKKIDIAKHKIKKAFQSVLSNVYLQLLGLKPIKQELLLNYWFNYSKRLKTKLQLIVVSKVVASMTTNQLMLTESISIQECQNARYLMGVLLSHQFVNGLVNSKMHLLYKYFEKDNREVLENFVFIARNQPLLQMDEQVLMQMDQNDIIKLLEQRQMTSRLLEIE